MAEPAPENPSIRELLVALGSLVPYTMLIAMTGGLMLPVVNYMSLNVLAAAHTDLPSDAIHCEASTLAPHCRAAVLDLNLVMMTIALMRPIFDVALAPALAVASDSWGRRPVIMWVQILSQGPLICLCLAFMGLTDIVWSLTAASLISTSLSTAVLNSSCIDRMTHSPSRAVAMGLMSGCDMVAHLAGLLMGYHLSLNVALAASMALSLLATLVTVAFLPESLGPSKRRPLSLRSLVPGVSLSILWRSPLIMRLTLIVIAASFCDGGFAKVIPFYMQRFMDWSIHYSYLYGILGDLSVIVWLSCIFKVLVDCVGEVGTLAVGRVACFLFALPMFLATTPSQVLFLVAVFSGPIVFVLPAVGGLKSRLVSGSEQGAMQGALIAVNSIAQSLGALALGSTFNNLSLSDNDALVTRSMCFITIGLTIPVLVLICDMWQEMRRQTCDGRNPLVDKLDKLDAGGQSYGSMSAS